MKLLVRPSRLCGTIAVPGSKSHTIRAIAGALMADGVSQIHAPLLSDDTLSALHAAARLGAQVREDEALWQITGTATPGADWTNSEPLHLDLGNSGTGLRLLSALAATATIPITFDGDASLRTRPMEPQLSALAQLGVKTTAAPGGKAPFTVCGPLSGGTAEVRAVSSQFLTALLFAAPFARDTVELNVPILNEKPYVEITLQWLDRLGLHYEASSDRSWFRIPAPQRFQPFTVTIPADFSTAAFPLGAGLLCAAPGGVRIANLDFTDAQGDKALFALLTAHGAELEYEASYVTVRGGRFTGGEIDLNAMPDALPLLSAVAAATPGTVTRIVNVPQARLKETDRICCMTTELRKMGAVVTELPDGMTIQGCALHGAALKGYDDHRIVMALAVAALAADGASEIAGAEACGVTYRNFIRDFQSLGADFTAL